jgi:sugar phosphate isomerase/epimerase
VAPVARGRPLLGYDTNGLQNHRLDDALRLLAEHGYRAVALTLDVMHLDPFHSSEAEVARVGALLRELDLVPAITTGARFLLDPRHKHEPTLMTREPGLRERRLGFYERAAAIGAKVGASVLAFWSGIDRAPDGGSFDWLCDGVRRSCALARAHGLVPALEPEPGMAVATLADFERLRSALGHEAPELCLDIGHLYVTGEGPPDALIRRHAGQLALVQIADMVAGVHEHLPPGEGDVDFARDLEALRAAGYGGPVCFELSRSSHLAPEALARCRDVFGES